MSAGASTRMQEDAVVGVAAVLAGGLLFAMSLALRQEAEAARRALQEREALLATLRGLHERDGAIDAFTNSSLDLVAGLFPRERLSWSVRDGAWFLTFDEPGLEPVSVGVAEPPR